MSNKYLELKERQQAESNAFPMAFAFSDEQFEEGMRSLGLAPTDTDKVVSIGLGGFIRKTDAPALREMFKRHSREREEAIAADKTGKDFIEPMFRYELANHEYGYTYDTEDTLNTLGITEEQIESNPVMLAAWERAKKDAVSACD